MLRKHADYEFVGVCDHHYPSALIVHIYLHLPLTVLKPPRGYLSFVLTPPQVPTAGDTVIQDIVYGEVTVQHSAVEDQVLLKSDGYPTYHLANVVDDHLMEITHVLRGEVSICSIKYHVVYHVPYSGYISRV